MTEGSGAIRARSDYDPYGRRTKVQGDLDSDFAFTGHYVHAPSGLYLALYRAYDSEVGRWVSRDPIAESGGMNLYAYIGNDPLNGADALGLDGFGTWITGTAQSAATWITGTAQSAATWIAGTAQSAATWIAGTAESAALTFLWATGLGKDKYTFDSDSAMTELMRTDPRIQ